MLRIVLSFSLFIFSFLSTQAFAANPSGFALVGVIADPNEKQSIVVISTANRQTLFLTIGDEIPGLQSYKIRQIARNHVVLSNGRQDMRLEHDGGSSGGGSFGGYANSSPNFRDQGGMTWSDDREAMMHDEPVGFQEDIYVDEEPQDSYDNVDVRQMQRSYGQDVRSRQIPGLILRNPGQGVDDPAFDEDIID
ncbi:MAG: type II secretion system protein N [Oligoflexus sp.]